MRSQTHFSCFKHLTKSIKQFGRLWVLRTPLGDKSVQIAWVYSIFWVVWNSEVVHIFWVNFAFWGCVHFGVLIFMRSSLFWVLSPFLYCLHFCVQLHFWVNLNFWANLHFWGSIYFSCCLHFWGCLHFWSQPHFSVVFIFGLIFIFASSSFLRLSLISFLRLSSKLVNFYHATAPKMR